MEFQGDLDGSGFGDYSISNGSERDKCGSSGNGGGDGGGGGGLENTGNGQ
jgi:hypothetical protein